MGLNSLLVLSCIAALSIVCSADTSQQYCAYSNPSIQVHQSLADVLRSREKIEFDFPPVTSGDVVNNTIQCTVGMNHCYWLLYLKDGMPQSLQGCWYPNNVDHNRECESSRCDPTPIVYNGEETIESLRFCCCRGDFCNTNDSALYSKPQIVPSSPPKAKQLVVPGWRPEPSKQLYCAFIDVGIAMNKSGEEPSFVFNVQYGDSLSDRAGAGVIQPDNTTIKCSPGVNHCFSLWMSRGGNQTFLKQGCWIPSNHDCDDTSCIATRHLGQMMPVGGRVCCCKGMFCNRNVSDRYVPPADVVTTPDVLEGPLMYRGENFDNYKGKIIAMAILPIIIVAILVILIFLTYRVWARSRKETPDAIHLMESTSSPDLLESLKLNTLINGGRYGEVWRGTLGDLDVAVKVFTGSSQKQYYISERDIYTLPHMSLDEMPRFYGSEDRVAGDDGGGSGVPQHLLVMEFIPGGTLTNYLKNHAFDCMTMCKLCRSVARGLSHLHTEIRKGDKKKPAIAHRDLNTRNILVRPDQTCVICDFGFAMQITGSNYIKNGSQEVAEQSSLNDVGTIRYMPPEVLEGAVNLRDCEASLKQIDVYALGLIFWEIGTRCTDLYQGLPVPEYQLPFQAELGLHPTFEEMTHMVSKNKARPLFPDVWKDSNQGIRALKETIEDCWDQDGEARLTALCVEERMAEMESLWAARQRGVTPKINTTNFQSAVPPIPEKPNQLCNANLVNEAQGGSNLDALRVHEHNLKNLETSPTIQLPPPSQATTSTNSSSIPANASSQAGRSRMFVSENSVSTATTDTMLSPTEMVRPPPNMSHPATWSMYVSRNNKVLPPHQGQNPTVERNTHKSSDEDLEIQGNTLVTKGTTTSSVTKGSASVNGFHAPPPPYPQHSPSVSDVLLDSLGTDTLETSLVQHDALNRAPEAGGRGREVGAVSVRNVPRIPYMQNDMVTEPLIVRPKQSNVQQESQLTDRHSEPRVAFLGKLFKGRKLPFFHKKSHDSSDNKNTRQPLTPNPAARDTKNLTNLGGGELRKVVVRQSAGASNLETAANQIGTSSTHHHLPSNHQYLSSAAKNTTPLATELRLRGDNAVVCATLGSSDGRGRHGTSHHDNPLGDDSGRCSREGSSHTSDSTELKKRYDSSASENGAAVAREGNPNTERDGSLASASPQTVGSSSNIRPFRNGGNVGKKLPSFGNIVNLSPVMEKSVTRGVAPEKKTPEGRPKRPSSLVIKSHGPLQNGAAPDRAESRLRAEDHRVNGDSPNFYSQHASSPDLSSIEVSPASVVFRGCQGQKTQQSSVSSSSLGNRSLATSE